MTWGKLVRLNRGPSKDIHVVVTGTNEYVTLHAKGTDVTKLRILRWTDYLGLSWWAQCNYKGPYKKKAGRSESEL